MGLTGDWDGRISRRTLLRAGGSATAAYVLLGRGARPRRRCRRRPVLARRRLGRPAPDGFVLWTRARARAARRRRDARRPRACATRSPTDEGFRQIVRRGADVGAAARGPHGARRVAGPAAGHAGTGTASTGAAYVSPRRAHPHGAGAGLDAAPLRFAFVSCQNYTQRLLRRLRATWRRRTSTSSCTSATTSTRGPASAPIAVARPRARGASSFSLDDYRTRHAQYKRDPRPAGRPRRVPVPDDVGRPRVQGQLRRPRPRAGRAARRRSRSGARPRTSPTGSTRRCRALASRSARTCRCSGGCRGAPRDLPRARHAPVPLGPDRASARGPARSGLGLLPRGCSTPRGILGAAQRGLAVRGPGRPGRGVERARQPGRFAPARRATPTLGERRTSASTPGTATWPTARRVLDFLAEQRLGEHRRHHRRLHEHSVRNVPPDFRSFDGIPVATEFMGTSLTSEGYDTAGRRPTFGGDPDNPHRAARRPPPRLRQGARSTRRVVGRVPWRRRRDAGPTSSPAPLATFVVENGSPGGVRAGV